MNKIGAVINSSGGMLSKQNDDVIDNIRQQLQKRVVPDGLAWTSAGEITDEIKRMIDRDIDVLAIGGGDGTISTAARLLNNTNIKLAVLPFGTRNHFARDLEIPLDYFEAIELLDRIKVKRLDVALINNHQYINNATLGLYPDIVRERKEKTKRLGLKKSLAHLAGSITALRRFPRMRLDIRIDDKKRMRVFTPFLFIGNNEYQDGILAERRPSINAGKLWYCTGRATNVWSLARMTLQISYKGFENAQFVETGLASAVTVYTRKQSVTLAVDGELQNFEPPLRFSIRKQSLEVVVP